MTSFTSTNYSFILRSLVFLTGVRGLLGQYYGGIGQSLAQLQSLTPSPLSGQFQQFGDGLSLSQPQLTQYGHSMGVPISPGGFVQPAHPAMLAQQSMQFPEVSALETNTLNFGTASVAVGDFLKLANAMEQLKSQTRTLEAQLMQTREAELKAEQVAAAAQSRSEKAEKDVVSVTENSKKMTSLAEVSVDEAKKSIDKEQKLVENMRKELQDTVNSESSLKAELDDAKAQAAVWRGKAVRIQKSEDDMIRTFQAELKQRDTAAAQASEAAARASEAAVEVAGLRRSLRGGSRVADALYGSASPYMQQQPSYYPQMPVPAASYAQTDQATVADQFEEPPLRRPSSDQYGFLSRRN
jgi:hypothetical protein